MDTRFTDRYLALALFAFAVAATTGVLLRFGLLYGLPSWAANYTAVRHAHSHLLYFYRWDFLEADFRVYPHPLFHSDKMEILCYTTRRL